MMLPHLRGDEQRGIGTRPLERIQERNEIGHLERAQTQRLYLALSLESERVSASIEELHDGSEALSLRRMEE
jgi:hypothetical protein